jgi:glutamate---cysteine ligase / carboxylate-amine ligase
VIDHRFGAAAPWSLGVEEEVVFVDAETLETASVFSQLVPESSERLKPELFECIAELTTPVVPDAETALAALRALRAGLADQAAQQNVLVHVAGTHALARGAGQPIVPVQRYQQLAAKLGDRIYRQLVCGLHVHVSLPDPDACLAAFEGVVPWLPTLLALSANSPFAEGADTGHRSERAERLLEMPTGGTPPVLRSWDDWEAATRGDSTRRHWDAWPRPEYGTLEVRVMDMQTDVRRSAGFAALVQALVATVANEPAEPYDRGLYAHRRAEATVDPPAPADVEALAVLVEPAAGDLNVWTLAEAVLAARPEAERQLEVAAAEGIAAVPRDVIERTVAFG